MMQCGNNNREERASSSSHYNTPKGVKKVTKISTNLGLIMNKETHNEI